ncbi:alpha/beta hydrolase [Pseudomonadota bacterium]
MELLTTVVALLVGLLLLLYIFQGKLVFFPIPLDDKVRIRYAPHELSINNNGVSLHGWLVRGEVSKSKPLLIYYGGNAEEVSSNLASLAELDVGSYLAMNYRGYGASDGQPTESSLFDDALFILDYIRKKENIDLAHIVLMGRSLGTGVASYVASKRRVGGVILISPFDSLSNLAKYHYPIVPVEYMLRHKFDSLSVAGKISSPAVMIFGSDDQIVPPKFSQNLIGRWGGTYQSVLIEGANHLNIQLHDQYWVTIRSFLKSLSKRGVL